MQYSKSTKTINKAKNSLLELKQNSSISVQNEAKKRVQNKSIRFDIKEKSPNVRENQKNFKYSSGLRSLKIPNRKYSDALVYNQGRTSEISPQLLRSPDFNSATIQNVKSSISPKVVRQLSPLSETSKELNKSTVNENFVRKGKFELNNLDLHKEFIALKPEDFESRKLISKESLNFQYIEENLKHCSQVVKSLLSRIEELGGNKEADLIGKFWNHVVVTVNQTIEAFRLNQKNYFLADEKSESNFCARVENQQFAFDSLKFEDDTAAFKETKFEDYIEKIQKKFEDLTEILKESENYCKSGKNTLNDLNTTKRKRDQKNSYEKSINNCESKV